MNGEPTFESEEEYREFWDRIWSDHVMHLSWDTGGPGGGGVTTMCDIDGTYYVNQDGEIYGPFDSADQAWRDGVAAGGGKLLLNTAISSVSSSLRSTDKLVEMIDASQCDDDHEVSINGNRFRVENGALL
jgi:hypothetical protein